MRMSAKVEDWVKHSQPVDKCSGVCQLMQCPLGGSHDVFSVGIKFSRMHQAAIAQLGERQTEDLKVPGSIPGCGMQCLAVIERSGACTHDSCSKSRREHRSTMYARAAELDMNS